MDNWSCEDGKGNDSSNGINCTRENRIIENLIEKTRFLAEELKNQNIISSELMAQNEELRKQYATLKDKFLFFLNEEEMNKMAMDTNEKYNSNSFLHLRGEEGNQNAFQEEKKRLEFQNQQLTQKLQEAHTLIATQEKSAKTHILTLHINENKDKEIQNLKQQILLLQEQLECYENTNLNQDQQNQSTQFKIFNSTTTQNLENMTSQKNSYGSNENGMYQIMNRESYINSQKIQPQTNDSSAGGQDKYYRTNSLVGADNILQKRFAHHHSQSTIPSSGQTNLHSARDINEVNSSGVSPLDYKLDYTSSQSSVRPTSFFKNSLNKYLLGDYNDLLYQQSHEQEQSSFYHPNSSQKLQRMQINPIDYSTKQQEQLQFQQLNNQQEDSDRKKSNNNLSSYSESNRLVLQAGMGKLLIDQQKPLIKLSKKSLHIDPLQAAKYARSTILKKNNPKGQQSSQSNRRK